MRWNIATEADTLACMELLDARPCELLADFVECYWSVNTKPHETSILPDMILPNGTSNLIFNLSSHPHREYCDRSLEIVESLDNRWYSGIRDSPIVVGPTFCTKVVGIRFKPGGLLPLLNVPGIEVAKMTADADSLWGSECEHIHERLYDEPIAKRRFRLLENWLLKRLDLRCLHLGLSLSINHLYAVNGNASMDDLARLADLSTRQYRRRFENAVGMAPKRLARILRFEKAVDVIGRRSHVDWARLSLECGYYDQAHLIADFREFGGVTPAEYLRRSPVVPGFLPIDGPMSVFSNTASANSAKIPAS